MTRNRRLLRMSVVLVGSVAFFATESSAQRRPVGNLGGAGGARPAVNRPAMPSGGMSRPAVNRPPVSRGPTGGVGRPAISSPSVNRPTPRPQTPRPQAPSVGRPGGAGTSNIGNLHPSGGRPGASRPGGPAAGGTGTGGAGLGGVGAYPRPTRPSPGVTRPEAGTRPRPDLRPGGGIAETRPGGITRPDLDLGAISRPTPGGVTRPTRPSFPEVSGRPLPQRPGGLPSENLRPSLPERPGIGGRPIPGERPRPEDRPGLVERPIRPLPGDRPSLGERPIPGERPRPGDRPSLGGRPLPGDRPSLEERPRPGDRPSLGGRPWPGRPETRPDFERPTIPGRPGGGNIGNIGNINIGNIGNQININNIGNVWQRPDWGWGRPGPDWHDRWVIHHHHHWHHGSWRGPRWGFWYVPVAWGFPQWTWWGVTTQWGFGPAFYNPYFVGGSTQFFDYSQPVMVNQIIVEGGRPAASPDDPSGAVPDVTQGLGETQESDEALAWFDDALDAFHDGHYSEAQELVERALARMPNDPVLHEFRALVLFALGDFQSAAATLNSLLATTSGMDWTTLSSLYGNVDDYTRQLRRLEAFVRENPDDAAAPFVLAYHYLILGESEAAKRSLMAVVEREPRDVTARRMLEALQQAEQSEASPDGNLPGATRPGDVVGTGQSPASATGPRDTGPRDTGPSEARLSETDSLDEESYEWPPELDLVGNWLAESEQGTFELRVDEESQFRWKAVEREGREVVLAGHLLADVDTLALQSRTAGTMLARVRVLDADRFQFIPAGANEGDPAVLFERQSEEGGGEKE